MRQQIFLYRVDPKLELQNKALQNEIDRLIKTMDKEIKGLEKPVIEEAKLLMKDAGKDYEKGKAAIAKRWRKSTA